MKVWPNVLHLSLYVHRRGVNGEHGIALSVIYRPFICAHARGTKSFIVGICRKVHFCIDVERTAKCGTHYYVRRRDSFCLCTSHPNLGLFPLIRCSKLRSLYTSVSLL